MKIDFDTIQAWVKLLPGVLSAGESVVNAISEALHNSGAEHDTAALDQIITDAKRRQTEAESEASGV